MTDLDRFKPPDIDESRVVAECAQCRGEIHEGDEVYRIDDAGGFVHDACASQYAKDRVYDCCGVIDANLDVN